MGVEEPTFDGDYYWTSIVTDVGARDQADPYNYIDGGLRPGDSYQLQNALAWKAEVLNLHLMPEMREVWNDTDIIDYVDRWVNNGTWSQPDICAPAVGICVGGTNANGYCNTAGENDYWVAGGVGVDNTFCTGGGWCNYTANWSTGYGVLYGHNSTSGSCILDTDASDGMGRFVQRHGLHADEGTYVSLFANSMWDTYRGLYNDSENDTTAPSVSLSYPADGYTNSTSQYVNLTFNASVSDGVQLANCSLWHNATGTWHLNSTQSLSGTSNVTAFSLNLTNVSFIWNINCYDNSSNSGWGSSNRSVVLNYGSSDLIYPTFSGFWDDNSSLLNSGIAHFNATVENTNGSVYLRINNTNYTATNLTSNVYNVSVNLTANGTYSYYWFAYGNGSSHNYNSSGTIYYAVNYSDVTSPQVTINSPTAITYPSSSIDFNVSLNENGTVRFSLDSGATNYTMSSEDNQNFNYSYSGLSDGSYVFSVYANDTSGNENSTESVSFVVDTSVEEGGDGGGGGGGGSSYWINTFNYDDEGIEERGSVIKGLKERQRVKILFNESIHYVGVVDLTENNVTVNVSSRPQQTILKIRQSRNFDLNEDGSEDIQVSLNSIVENIAHLTISVIYPQNVGEIPDEEDNNSPENEGEKNNEEIIEKINLGLQKIFVYVIGIIIALVVVVLLLIVKRFRKNKKTSRVRSLLLTRTPLVRHSKGNNFWGI